MPFLFSGAINRGEVIFATSTDCERNFCGPTIS